MSQAEFRRLFRYAEAQSSGERAQGKQDDPLRAVGELIAANGGTAVEEEGFRVTLPDDSDEQVYMLRSSLMHEGIPHRLSQALDAGLTEEVSWHSHGDHDHERAVVRTRTGEIAMLAATWVEIAVVSKDADIRERLNDYFFTDGHHTTDIPLDIDDDIADDEQLVLDLLLQEKILVTQGTGFNWPTPDHLRIVTLPWARDLAKAIERLGNFLVIYRQ